MFIDYHTLFLIVALMNIFNHWQLLKPAICVYYTVFVIMSIIEIVYSEGIFKSINVFF